MRIGCSCRSACIEIKESEKIFTELIRSIEKIHTEVIELIGANEKAAVNQAEGRMKKLEQEIAELRRRNAELKELSETEDHIHFLQNVQSLCAPPEAGDLPSVTVNTDISFGAVRKAVSELKDHIEDFCKGELVKITTTDEDHKSHDTVSAEKERTGKQKQLGETQTEIQQRIQERLKETEELKQAVESLKRSACIEIKESEKIFTELIRSIEKIHTEVIELIGANEKAAVNQAEGRMKKLEQEIAELRRRNTELKQLSETEDHIHFLQNFQSLCAPPEAGDVPSVTVNTEISFGAVRKAVSELKDHIEDFCKGELVKITTTDSCQLTLDPNTANRELCLSEGNRKVTQRREIQRYPDHSERFDSRSQVLCREGLSGTRCYWEIECSGRWTSLGVTYKGIGKKGGDLSCRLGFNDKSWSLRCSDSSYTARHNNNRTAITAPRSPRIGVYLDFNAGTLSFYGVSDTMTLLHRFQTTFTEPLYPGFGLHCYDSPVTICQLN
ncbi:UNVERIFIED_CONTAM: hypothetical protein FKN15_066290 [Acipenser sinensis]